jgi:putative inorganic carbon (hco3(-)) transporter
MRKLKRYNSAPIYHNIPTLILRLEWIWIAVMVLAFWHHSPPIRDNYIFLLSFVIPILGARWLVHRRLFTRTPLDILLLIFMIISVYNFNYAPLSRASYFVLICRPLLGIFIIAYFAEHARQHGHIHFLTIATILLGILIGGVALLTSQWDIANKSSDFAFILTTLPKLDYKQVMPDMRLSFNVNEIAGALAYFAPFLLAITLKTFVHIETANTRYERIIYWILRWGALFGFLLTSSALLLGQSRFALGGVFVGLFIVIMFVLPNWKLRMVGLGIWGIFVIIEVMIVMQMFPLTLSQTPNTEVTQSTSTTLNQRDERTLSTRFELWERALWMVRDYPTTGAGMSTYRALVMRDEYIIPYYEAKQISPPHAHNTFLQFGADLGVMGLALFIGLYGSMVWIIIQIYHQTNVNFRIMTISITSGILSYMGYGVGDTITLWDRFAFLHWWFIAFMISVYIVQKYHSPVSPHNS